MSQQQRREVTYTGPDIVCDLLEQGRGIEIRQAKLSPDQQPGIASWRRKERREATFSQIGRDGASKYSGNADGPAERPATPSSPKKIHERPGTRFWPTQVPEGPRKAGGQAVIGARRRIVIFLFRRLAARLLGLVYL